MTDEQRDDADRPGGGTERVGRDERRLPLPELDRAMATYSFDGQVDDATGGDAGDEAEFGDGYRARDAEIDAETGASGGNPPPDTEAGRSLAPSPDGPSPVGRTGPV